MDPEFLDLADVLLIHEEQLARFGGSAGLRDEDSSSRPWGCRVRPTKGWFSAMWKAYAAAIAKRPSWTNAPPKAATPPPRTSC